MVTTFDDLILMINHKAMESARTAKADVPSNWLSSKAPLLFIWLHCKWCRRYL